MERGKPERYLLGYSPQEAGSSCEWDNPTQTPHAAADGTAAPAVTTGQT